VQPHVAHRSLPHKFLGDAICLILRSCGCGVAGRGAECSTFFGVAGVAPKALTFSKLSGANPASHNAAHHANFSATAIADCN